jgi:hypothetical protein
MARCYKCGKRGVLTDSQCQCAEIGRLGREGGDMEPGGPNG